MASVLNHLSSQERRPTQERSGRREWWPFRCTFVYLQQPKKKYEDVYSPQLFPSNQMQVLEKRDLQTNSKVQWIVWKVTDDDETKKMKSSCPQLTHEDPAVLSSFSFSLWTSPETLRWTHGSILGEILLSFIFPEPSGQNQEAFWNSSQGQVSTH